MRATSVAHLPEQPAASLTPATLACPPRRGSPAPQQFFFVGSCARPAAQLRGKTGLASLNRFRPTPVGSQQGICAPYPNAAVFSWLGESVEAMADKGSAIDDKMDEASDTHVADSL